MGFKKSSLKSIPGTSDGTYVGEVSRLTEMLRGPVQLARIERFRSGDIKELDPQRSLIFSQWGISLCILCTFIHSCKLLPNSFADLTDISAKNNETNRRGTNQVSRSRIMLSRKQLHFANYIILSRYNVIDFSIQKILNLKYVFELVSTRRFNW